MRLPHPSWLHLLPRTSPERCRVTNEREIAHFSCCVQTFSIFRLNARLCLNTVCMHACVCVLCGCSGVARECTSALASVQKEKKKRSLHKFKGPNQRLVNFPRLLCSSEATAGSCFSWLSPVQLPHLSHSLSDY